MKHAMKSIALRFTIELPVLLQHVRLRSLDINIHKATLLKFELDGTMGWVREKM